MARWQDHHAVHVLASLVLPRQTALFAKIQFAELRVGIVDQAKRPWLATNRAQSPFERTGLHIEQEDIRVELGERIHLPAQRLNLLRGTTMQVQHPQ